MRELILHLLHDPGLSVGLEDPFQSPDMVQKQQNQTGALHIELKPVIEEVDIPKITGNEIEYLKHFFLQE